MSKYYCNLIDYQIVVNATNHDAEALYEIIKHYKKYIKKLSAVDEYDENGECHSVVNSNIEANLETDLMLGVLKFKIKK